VIQAHTHTHTHTDTQTHTRRHSMYVLIHTHSAHSARIKSADHVMGRIISVNNLTTANIKYIITTLIIL